MRFPPCCRFAFIFCGFLGIAQAFAQIPATSALPKSTRTGPRLPSRMLPGQAAVDSGTNADDDIPAPTRQLIKDRFRTTFLLPDLALWKFDYTRPYPTGGTAVCGRVNFPNSMRRYDGDKPFFGLFVNGRLTEAEIAVTGRQDPVHATSDAYRIACKGV